MTPSEIKVGNYEFSEFEPDKDGGQIVFTVKGREGYTLTEKDKQEITKILKYIGNWEKSRNYRSEETGEPIEPVYIADYVIDPVLVPCDDGRRVKECFNVIIRHKTNFYIPMLNFWDHIQNAIKWKNLVDTRSNLGLRGMRC